MIIPKKIFIYGSSCCLSELNSLFSPIYDLERLSFYIVDSLNKADIIIIVGKLSKKEKEEIEILKQKGKKIIALGNCRIKDTEFDLASIGCPPRPETIIETLLEIRDGI